MATSSKCAASISSMMWFLSRALPTGAGTPIVVKAARIAQPPRTPSIPSSQNAVKGKSKSTSTDIRGFFYLKSKRCILVAVKWCLAKLGLQYGCCNLGWKEFCRTYVLPAKQHFFESRQADLRTAYPCSSYEFACARASLYWCVRKSRLSMGFLALLAMLLVHCVLACTSPVAVRLQYIRGRQFFLRMRLRASVRV